MFFCDAGGTRQVTVVPRIESVIPQKNLLCHGTAPRGGRGIYCPIIREGGGVGINPVPFEYFGKKSCTFANFPYLRAKIEHFYKFFEKL